MILLQRLPKVQKFLKQLIKKALDRTTGDSEDETKSSKLQDLKAYDWLYSCLKR